MTATDLDLQTVAADMRAQALLGALPGHPRLVLAAPSDAIDWHDARRLGLGGSDVAAALGFDDYRSPYEVWADKRGLTEARDVNEAMAWGQRLEPIVAEWAADRLGATTIPTPGILAHAEHPWALGNIDRLLARPEGLAVLECKVSRWHERWEDDDLPARVEIQARWYLAVTGLEVAYVAALLHGTRGELRPVERDEQLEAWLLSTAEQFWQGVQRGTPPPPGPSPDVTRLLNRIPSQQGVTVDLDESWREGLREHAALKVAAKIAQADLDACENLLRSTLGEAEAGYLDGAEVVTYRTHTTRRLDAKRLAADHPEVADAYRTESPSRPLRVKEPTT